MGEERVGAGGGMALVAQSGFRQWLTQSRTAAVVAGVCVGVACWKLGVVEWALGEFGAALHAAHRARKRRKRPEIIVVVRHGESKANVDPTCFESCEDHRVPLAERGKTQAQLFGHNLRQLLGSRRVKFFVSPFRRANQTLAHILRAFPDPSQYRIRCDPRLREQQRGSSFSHFQRLALPARERRGKFFRRLGGGESGADVYDRVSSFIESLYRDIDRPQDPPSDAVVIVCHGITMRLFAMRYLRWSTAFFESVANPSNCESWMFVKNSRGSYDLVSPVRRKTRRQRRHDSSSDDGSRAGGAASPPPPPPQQQQQQPSQHHYGRRTWLPLRLLQGRSPALDVTLPLHVDDALVEQQVAARAKRRRERALRRRARRQVVAAAPSASMAQHAVPSVSVAEPSTSMAKHAAPLASAVMVATPVPHHAASPPVALQGVAGGAGGSSGSEHKGDDALREGRSTGDGVVSGQLDGSMDEHSDDEDDDEVVDVEVVVGHHVRTSSVSDDDDCGSEADDDDSGDEQLEEE